MTPAPTTSVLTIASDSIDLLPGALEFGHGLLAEVAGGHPSDLLDVVVQGEVVEGGHVHDPGPGRLQGLDVVRGPDRRRLGPGEPEEAPRRRAAAPAGSPAPARGAARDGGGSRSGHGRPDRPHPASRRRQGRRTPDRARQLSPDTASSSSGGRTRASLVTRAILLGIRSIRQFSGPCSPVRVGSLPGQRRGAFSRPATIPLRADCGTPGCARPPPPPAWWCRARRPGRCSARRGCSSRSRRSRHRGSGRRR